jgi:hypothetical protein
MTTKHNLLLAKCSLIVAGILLLYETLLGCFYVLGIGFSTKADVILDLCLTMAFPIFLICLRSVRGAAIGLWVFFAIQWIDICFGKWPPAFVNPLAWVHGAILFISTVLVSLSAWTLSRRVPHP